VQDRPAILLFDSRPASRPEYQAHGAPTPCFFIAAGSAVTSSKGSFDSS
jgi:hypothetical protein